MQVRSQIYEAPSSVREDNAESAMSRAPFLATPLSKIAFLAVLAVCVFFVPYLVPVSPSVSMSYLTGFSNRTAALLFASGCVLFAVLNRGEIAAFTDKNTVLCRFHLYAALAVVAVGCSIDLYPFSTLPHGSEAGYNINRLQMLLAGGRPYRDFEFAYGAAHLYVPYLFVKVFRASALAAYYPWWVLEWFIGTAMIWYTIKHLDLAIERRALLFWALFAMNFPGISLEGIAYTPVRGAGSAFLIIWAHSVFTRARRPLAGFACSLFAICAGLAISPELGVGLAAGLCVWYAVLRVTGDARVSLLGLSIFFIAVGAIFLVANKLDIFATMKEFAGGAFSYPLLLTAPVLLVLSVYVLATCAAVRELFRNNYRSMAIPLAAAGLAMVPAAMGRIDLARLQSAAPAFLLGLGVIEGMPAIRVWWRPLGLYALFLPLGIINPPTMIRAEIQRIRHSSNPGTAQIAPHQPCREIYRTPDILPPVTETAQQSCLETGYFNGPVNAFTPDAINRKINELAQRPRKPVVLFDLPLSRQMPTLETDLSHLQWQGDALYLPKIRHTPVTYDPIFEYIVQNFVPDPNPIPRPDGWNYRVWRPKSAN